MQKDGKLETIKSTGAGIYGEINNRLIFERKISLGGSIEVYNAELIAIREGFNQALKTTLQNKTIENIYLFLDN